jgi:hypothetical protein
MNLTERDSRNLTKTQLALQLLQAFKDAHGDINIKTPFAPSLFAGIINGVDIFVLGEI